MPGEPVTQEAGEIVEQRMAHRLKAHETTLVFPWGVGWERTEPVVLPPDIVATVGAVGDPEAALARHTDESAIAKQRAEDHLELHRVWWHPAERAARMLDHNDEFDRRLRPTEVPAAGYLEKRRRLPIRESLGS